MNFCSFFSVCYGIGHREVPAAFILNTDKSQLKYNAGRDKVRWVIVPKGTRSVTVARAQTKSNPQRMDLLITMNALGQTGAPIFIKKIPEFPGSAIYKMHFRNLGVYKGSTTKGQLWFVSKDTTEEEIFTEYYGTVLPA